MASTAATVSGAAWLPRVGVGPTVQSIVNERSPVNVSEKILPEAFRPKAFGSNGNHRPRRIDPIVDPVIAPHNILGCRRYCRRLPDRRRVSSKSSSVVAGLGKEPTAWCNGSERSAPTKRARAHEPKKGEGPLCSSARSVCTSPATRAAVGFSGRALMADARGPSCSGYSSSTR